MTTERAPVAGQQGRGGAGAGGRHGGRSILEGLVDPDRAGGIGSNPVVDQLLRSGGAGRGSPFGSLIDMPSTPGGDVPGAGAAAAAGVLTAVDEDNEGDEEAKVPNSFDYFSDASDDEEDDE